MNVLPGGLLKCVCGQHLRAIEGDLYRCPSCGRVRWGNDDVSGAMIITIALVTIVTLIVLAIVGINGAKYR
jgi:hypothetical protein